MDLLIIKISAKYENLNMITNGKIVKSKKFQEYIKNIITKILLKNKKKEEDSNPQDLENSSTIKYVKPKTMAKKIPNKLCKSNLDRVSDTGNKLKITEVNNLSPKHRSKAQERKSLIQTKKSNNINISDFKDSSQNSSHCNSIPKRGKTRRKNNDFLLDYVNRNIKDDNAVLNNPGQFYNGLFNDIMKKVSIKKRRNSISNV